MDTILIVDDDHHLRQSFERLLREEGYAINTASSGEQALALFHHSMPDCIIMDVRMPGMDGLETLKALRLLDERIPVIIMTAFSTTQTAIEATKLGAFDYIVKPFEIPAILELIRKAIEAGRRMRAQVRLTSDLEPPTDVDALVGRSTPMHALYKAIGRVAPTDTLVLLRGESGTGKELVARALYQHSLRARKPFNVINCVAIPDTLLESELFGYEKGAFTGADTRRIGKIEQAEGGTIFLDEIGDIPMTVQAKLLRLLQERQIERLGGRDPIHVNVRIIAATNANLENAVATGRFREDLYYRLKVVSLHLPPLRERKEDISLLVEWFLKKHAASMDIPNPGIEASTLEHLSTYPWPGNVRELANAIQKALVFNQGVPLKIEDFTLALAHTQPIHATLKKESTVNNGEIDHKDAVCLHIQKVLQNPPADPFDMLMNRMGRAILREALHMTKGNRSEAARLLGMSRPTLLARMEKYGLKVETNIS